MFFWFVAGMHSGTGYSSGIFTRAGTGMGEVFYLCASTGNLAGKILSRGYRYGIAIPDGYIPVAIFTLSSSDNKLVLQSGKASNVVKAKRRW
jgi:hypothetical protein